MKEVKLSNCENSIKMDDADYERVKVYKWYIAKNKRSIKANINGTTINIGQFILGKAHLFTIDHINRDIFNNQKSNLRFATYSENQMNSGLQNNNTSKYKGVSWMEDRGQWRARIQVNKKQITLGYYSSKIKAALVYNQAAIKYHGEFAYLNDVKEEK